MSLSKKNKVVLVILFIAIISGLYIYKTAYKPHKTIDQREVKFSGTTKSFSEKVKQDVAVWQDVVVELEGKVTAIDDKGFMLDSNVYCQLETSTINIKKDQVLKVKGRMIGYDDLLEELKLDQIKIIK
ncbi:MAG: hypothetical protein BM557_07775 [Flavobacterium sp. MedPE-SWcel]|uniref:hypothetical protein n=1 Tax=uncultured Flavobacterium sp. TaxID=165435 RepID=UPI00091065FC|nr:hypothetical protein [uncultured Flavobacterium sp.]OIQ18106.1 MAG: hypothetical protein BM557_07775 [Flavobacterium sp. MedPE-SWcel]